MFWLIYITVNIKNIRLYAGMEMPAPLINTIFNKALFTPTHTSIRCSLKSFTFCTFFWYTCCPRFYNEVY